ncbi:MAG: DNA internalization-related competence protein ComEC/Rec2 [Firmicutes bacterium]|nr:DNA internalization-related competence protein ComEC/Rec2 [Bacillota bacterium]
MRRPLVFAAAAFGSGAGIAHLAQLCREAWLMCFFTAAGVLLVLNIWNGTFGKRNLKETRLPKQAAAFPMWSGENKNKFFLFICIFFIGGLLMQTALEWEPPIVRRDKTAGELCGLVTEISRKDDGLRLIAETPEGRILISCYREIPSYEEMVGRKACFRGSIFLPAQRRNPKCFDYRMYLKSCGIYAQMTADSVVLHRNEKVSASAELLRYVFRIRCGFAEKLEAKTDPDTKSMVMAMMFGDKSGLDEEAYEDFQRNGTAHVLAVSGLHVGVIYGFFAFFWRGKKGVLFYCSTSMLLLLYTALAEFSPSVIRAAVMISIHLGAGILHRRYDFLSAAAFTFLLMLSLNPLQLFHMGFQLSFLAAASIGVILPFAEKLYQGIFLSSLVIQAGMVPYTAYVFNYLSFGAIFANIPVVFLAGILMPIGMCTLFFSGLSDTLFGMGTAFLAQGFRLMVWINELFYAGGRTAWDVVSPSVFLLAVYYGALFFFLSEKGRILFLRKEWKKLSAAALLIVGTAGFLSAGMEDGFSRAQIVFVDVGQGDCIHIKTPDGKHYLLDGGGSIRYDVGKKTLKPYLLKNGVKKLDAAFVTHLHEDHYGGIRSLAQQGMVDRIGVYEGNKVLEEKLKKESGAKFLYLHKGQRVTLGENVYLDILAPEKKTKQEYEEMAHNQEDENASSLIMKLTCENCSVLITGDLDQDGESGLVDMYGEKGLHCDVLKVAHHGSKYSSCDKFIDAVSPKAAVFQVGKNNFGHPDKTVIEKYRQRVIMVYRNDTSGAIGLCKNTSGRGISIQKMIE